MEFIRALPLMRAMCGSTLNLNVEWAMMGAMLQQLDTCGQLHTPVAGDGPPEDTSYPVMNGLAVLALLTWYGRYHNQAWLSWAKLIVEGLKTP